MLLGLIAEKVDGKPLARAMQDRLFGPLGMHDTLLPPRTSNTIPDPYSHGYLYGSSSFVLTDTPYPPDIQAAARAGTLLPTDYTNLNPSFGYFPGGVISTANDLAIWIEALVTGRVFDATYQRRWLDSLQAKDPSMPNGQQYGYGMERLRWGPNAVYFHGGEIPGYNSHMGYDPNSRVTFVTWTNLPISVEGKWTSMTLVLKIWDQIYVVSPLTAFPSPSATP
jgi:D-alanyl-D-alanine carboxypeptidase